MLYRHIINTILHNDHGDSDGDYDGDDCDDSDDGNYENNGAKMCFTGI